MGACGRERRRPAAERRACSIVRVAADIEIDLVAKGDEEEEGMGMKI
jgi:hypothetical protein